MQISSYGCMRKIAKYRTCARVARSIAENASSFLSANRKSPKVGKNSCLWSYGSNIKVLIDFCWLFCPLKLDLESKVPIPSASRSFSRESRTSVTAVPKVIFPITHLLLKLGRNRLFARAARKIGFTQICSVQIWCQKVQTWRKSEAKMANQALAYQFTWGFEFVGKCGIYRLWPWDNLTAHFFAPYLNKFGENQIFRAVVGSQSNSVSR